MRFDRSTRIREVLITPAARAVVDRYLPGILDQPRITEADDVAEGSALVTVPSAARRWATAEVVLTGPSRGNPFVDVELTASVTLGGTVSTVGGFYDGDGRWVFRYLPEATGTCRFTTSSTARSLTG